MSRFELTDKVAIVTGGGGTGHGIGRSIALALAEAGADVAVVGRHHESLAPVVTEIEARGRRGTAIVADVTEVSQVARMVREAQDALGPLDILVNSAGGFSFSKPEDIAADDWRGAVELNLNATFFCSQAAARVMIPRGRGKIVNVASSSGIKGEEFMAAYAAAKAAVINLTRSLAISWAEHNVNVNCVAPGSVQVPEHAIDGLPDEAHAKLRERQASDEARPLQLPAEPRDIADATVFFASSGSDSMTGETLVVRGAEWASAYS